MSYSFDGANDRLLGSFTSTYADPLTLAAWVKITDHLINTDTILMVGNSNASQDQTYSIRTGNVDNTWRAFSRDTGQSAASFTLAADNTWLPIVCKFSSNTSRTVYAGALANSGTNEDARSVGDAIQHIAVGRQIDAAGEFLGLIAEVAVWTGDLSDEDITSFLAGTAASSIDAGNLIGYWPLSADNATQANLGLDAAGDLTVTGAVFDADHPTITTPSTGVRSRRLLLGVG